MKVIAEARQRLAAGKGIDLDRKITLMPGSMQTLTVDVNVAPMKG